MNWRKQTKPEKTKTKTKTEKTLIKCICHHTFRYTSIVKKNHYFDNFHKRTHSVSVSAHTKAHKHRHTRNVTKENLKKT